jgi:hypothetical protein
LKESFGKVEKDDKKNKDTDEIEITFQVGFD